MSGKIHCKRHKQNYGQNYQQGRVSADSNFATCDFSQNPYSQPKDSDQDYRDNDYETAIGHGSPNWIGNNGTPSTLIPEYLAVKFAEGGLEHESSLIEDMRENYV
ncbi:hypothetical protein [Nitrosovibrio sp. Nv6]|uniref:hypothetical protein n=1 Tax=Nitrosovibrio sp. Nv6 TaxID=1855340 RepID=UPI00115F7CE4|nr:hypothetical protein [Nitrosovibrio sp. Nv6]